MSWDYDGEEEEVVSEGDLSMLPTTEEEYLNSSSTEEELLSFQPPGNGGAVENELLQLLLRYDDSDDVESNNNDNAEEDTPPTAAAATTSYDPVVPASAHSYLPGNSHPLYTEGLLGGVEDNNSESCFRTRCSHQPHGHSTWNENSSSFELIILELPGVVLFPGMTIPLRLEEPGSFSMSSAFWMLHRQIQLCRRTPGQSATVQLGILTKLDPADEAAAEALDQQEDNDERNPASTTTTTAATRMELRLRRRSSWMRRAFGPERLQRFSQQILQEFSMVEDFLSVAESVHQVLLDGPIRPPSPHPPPPVQQQRPQRDLRPRARNSSWSVGGRSVTGIHRQQSMSSSGDDETEASSPQEEVAFLHRRRGGHNRSYDAEQQINNGRTVATRSDPNDPYANRIGTLATVTYTHGDDSEVLGTSSQDFTVNQDRPRPRASLVLTAVGTGRFRILSKNNGENDPLNNQRSSSSGIPAFETNLYNHHRLFVRTVQEWSYERIPMRMPSSSTTAAVSKNITPRDKYDLVSQAMVSVWTKNIYDNYWPWKLMEELRDKIQESPCLNQIISSSQENNNMPSHPYQFSYWLATHLPLSERERLQVLQCATVSERLRWFLRHTLFFDHRQSSSTEAEHDRGNHAQDIDAAEEQQQHSDHNHASDVKELVCKSCQIPIAAARHLFTLAGAEGTVGNYVNPHGVIHATMTVRHVDPNEVRFYGRAETKDSWFPGYAWTIMSCALCNAHLGWKFTLVDNNNNNNNNNDNVSSAFRPAQFFGLSATGVTMTTNLRRLRRLSSSRNGARRTRQRSMAGEAWGDG